jgi:hypothetical protein
MKLRVFSVYDTKTEAYMTPLFFQSKGQAVRSFTEVANDKDHAIGKYPEDFTLFEIGIWEDADCKFDLYLTPMSVGKAIEFLRV